MVSKVPSTSFSDGSKIVPDYYGKMISSGLRRAIDQKMRKLRTLASADKDITTELDRVVCRLMKFALCTSKERQNPPPINWMQCKLFDLLTLTEKAIERRRLQRYSLKAIEYQPESREIFSATIISDNDIVSHETRKDSIGELIVSKYQNFDLPPDRELDIKGNPDADDFIFDDSKISVFGTPFKGIMNEILNCENNIQEKVLNDAFRINSEQQNNIQLENGQSVTCHLELVPYNRFGRTADEMKSENSTCSSFNGIGCKEMRLEDNNQFTFGKVIKTNGSRHNTQTKKKSSRRSSYLNLKKYVSFPYNKYKSLERKKPRDHQIIQSTTSRPIPASLIELCDSRSNKNSEKKNSITSNSNVNGPCQPINDISATEKCMFIGIVTEDGEEIIAMRRHMGISPELDLDIIENEDLLQSVVNFSEDYNFYYKSNIKTDNIQSQTIFLYDLEEPSTSKGIRHLSADVQCGPDMTMTPSMLSQTTSFERIPKLFATGIKIEESKTDVVKSNKITSNFGTCTDECDTTVAVKIEESIQNVTEYFTNEQVIEGKTFSLSKFDQKTDTNLLKPVCSTLKTEDSGSEFCESVGSSAKSPTRLAISSTNTSDFQIQSVSNEKNLVIKLTQASCIIRNLACGGVHVHSFKERQVSEDVVYLGEWQRKHLSHKKYCSSIIRKNISLSKRPHLKEHSRINEITNPSKKTLSVTKPKSTIKNREHLDKPDQNKNTTKTVNTSENITAKKVAPKMPLSSKNLKTIYTKRTSINTIDNNTKTEDGYVKNKKVQNYLPLYLVRKMKTSNIKENKNDDKINLNSKHITEKENLNQPLTTGEVTKDLINIREQKLATNINYMIFRNEIQSENDTNIQSAITTATGTIKNETSSRSHSPQSQHSSTCSSPNSVSTVRAVSTRNRISSNRRNSTSSERSSTGILEADNKTPKCKKFSRRGKNNKKPAAISNMLSDNKENFPESSKENYRTEENLLKKDKVAKSVFLGRTKSVFMAQVTTETSTLPLTSTSISKTKMLGISKTIKLANFNVRSDDQTIENPSSSVFDSSLDKYSIDIESEHIFSTNENNDFVYAYNSLESDSLNEADDELLNSQKSVHNTKSSIISAIRKLIENKLNIPEHSYEMHDSDSETVILSRDDNYDVKSPLPNIHSIQSTNEVTFGLGTDVDHSDIHSSSMVNENNLENKSENSEYDALSLKSFASVSTSKFSEYYLADNELETTITETDKLNVNSIQDIFERKELNNLIPNAGVLAIQAFSGFSVNEPITGDQPDFVNFIDSETGSFAFESARQAASEEIFVSGRSSDTYESCNIDEDAYVPNWLFNMISQEHSAENSDAEEINLPMLPIVEPDYDVNGNVMQPGIGIGAGAGDGRGMHSDHSQDSSGRGTSLSSSEISSEPQSEVILSNPSNITAQADHLREPMNMDSMIEQSRPDVSTVADTGENSREETSSHQIRIPRNLINIVQVASDVDADVSSLGTDAVDSDN